MDKKAKKAKKQLTGFVEFVRTQGVIGLAIGFILGGSIQKVVSSLVTDLINPLVSMLLGPTATLTTAVIKVGSAELLLGHFVSTVIDFLVLAAVVYFGFKGLGLEKLDKKNS